MNIGPIDQINLFEHHDSFNVLINLYLKDKLPNKILLSGEKGIGKCTIAYHLINYVLSSDEDYPYNLENFTINSENKSYKLTSNRSSTNFNLIDVTDDKKNIDINQIRHLIMNLNKSSFNLKPRFVLIDNIELLNINSVNALLKILEEPNDNIYFILINNNKKILPTLKSRCLNFKITLTYDQAIKIVNKILGCNINDLVNDQFITNYSTPGQLLKIINLANENNIDLRNIDLKNFLSLMFKEKYYKKDLLIKNLIYSLIELYFRNNISFKDNNLINIHNYFIRKIDNIKKFNLDEETLFMEFEDKVLNG